MDRQSIGRKLETAYGLEVEHVAFVPKGNDSSSWSCLVFGRDATRYFLKVRADDDGLPGAIVPLHLHRQGIANVLAPLAPRLDVWPRVGRFGLVLFPFVDGREATEAGMSSELWPTLGTTLKSVHALRASDEVLDVARQETFVPTRRELIPTIEAALRKPGQDRVSTSLAAEWTRRRDTIHSLVATSDALGERLSVRSLPRVLCHGDIHTWNILIDGGGALWILDWDEATIAPRERDLMFVIAGIAAGLVAPADTAAFMEGYGDPSVDDEALSYYRYAWAVQDICAYAESAILLPGVSDDERAAALEGFRSLFDSGAIVDIASRS